MSRMRTRSRKKRARPGTRRCAAARPRAPGPGARRGYATLDSRDRQRDQLPVQGARLASTKIGVNIDPAGRGYGACVLARGLARGERPASEDAVTVSGPKDASGTP